MKKYIFTKSLGKKLRKVNLYRIIIKNTIRYPTRAVPCHRQKASLYSTTRVFGQKSTMGDSEKVIRRWNTSGMRWMLCWNQTDMKEIRDVIGSSDMKRSSGLKYMFAKSVMDGTYAKRSVSNKKYQQSQKYLQILQHNRCTVTQKNCQPETHPKSCAFTPLVYATPFKRKFFLCEVCNIKINIFFKLWSYSTMVENMKLMFWIDL